MITTLTGNNDYLIVQELQARTEKFVAEHGDLALESLDGSEATFNQMQGSLESTPFLSSKKLVILRSPSSNKDFSEQLEQVVGRVADTTDVILFEPKLDKRTAYYKHLKKLTEFLEYSQLDLGELASWLVLVAKNRGGTLSSHDARNLIERVGTNQQLLSGELDKLLSYDPHISRQTIELLTDQIPQSTVFQLLDAAFQGNIGRSLDLYEEQRRQRMEPLAIMGMIAWQLHALAIVKTGGNKPANIIAAKAKLSPYVVQKTQSIAAKLTLSDIQKLIRQAADLDAQLKSTNIDPDEALRQLLIDITDMI